MIRSVWKHLFLVPALLGLVAAPATAQLEANLSALTGPEAKGYLGPMATGLSATMGSAIFRSGHVPTVGFNFLVDLNAIQIGWGDDAKTYQTPERPGYASVTAPTVVGSTQSVVVNHDTLGPSAQFAYPGGFDFSKFAVAVPQLTIGNVLGTRAIVRYISVSLGDEDLGDLKFFGLGGQHSISRYFPGLPVDVAAGAMWQKFDIGEDVIKSESVNLNLTGSKAFGVGISFVPYVGLGLDMFKMEANYESGSENVTVDFDRSNDFRFTLGAGLNLPVVKLFAEFNAAAENGFSGGLSLGI